MTEKQMKWIMAWVSADAFVLGVIVGLFLTRLL